MRYDNSLCIISTSQHYPTKLGHYRFSHFCRTVHAALGVLSVILTDKSQKMKIANEFVSDFTAVGIWAHIPAFVGLGTNVRQVLADF